MSLKPVVAAPFRQRGTHQLPTSEFIVALSLDRDWFSPDQAKQIVTLAIDDGLLDRTDDDLHIAFDPDSVAIQPNYSPSADVLDRPSLFERIVQALVAAGIEKHEAVAGINAVQAELGLTVEAAAIVFAHKHGLAIPDASSDAYDKLTSN